MFGPAVLLLITAALWATPVAAVGPAPFECTGEAFMVQENQATLYEIDQSGPSFNLGFRSTDGLLYATMISYDTDGDPTASYSFSSPQFVGIFQIDSTGKVFGPLSTSGVTIPNEGLRDS